MAAKDSSSDLPPLWRSREFAAAFLPTTVILAIVVSAYFFLDYVTELGVVRTLERSHTEVAQRTSERRIQEVARDVRILSESQSIRTYLTDPTEVSLERMSQEFTSLCRHRGVFDQVRFLNAAGLETLRVNFNNGACDRTPDSKLQDKSRRYYFKDAFRLSRGEVFYSPMDLNVERGAIERPFKPMIRIGMPVFDDDNNKRGIVLVNYLADDLRNQLRQTLISEHSKPFLLNRDGYWLLASRQTREWGFMFEDGPKFADSFPGVWNSIEAADVGQVSGSGGIFSWASVFPMEEGAHSSSGSDAPFAQSAYLVSADDYVWRVGTHVPAETIAALGASRLRTGAGLYAVLLVVAMVGSWFLAYERRRATQLLQGLRESEKRMRAIAAELGEGLILIDASGQVKMMNPKAEKLLGWPEASSVGENFHQLIHAKEDGTAQESPVSVAQRTRKMVHVEEDRFATRSGGSLPVAYTAAPLSLSHDEPGIILTFEDITERKEAKAKLAHLATHDPLTGLANRREVERRLDQAFAQSARYEETLSVCILDVDHFKKVNDELGHQAGDEVLRHLSQRLHDNTRDADCVGRYGGEEFLLVLPHTDLDGARRLCERIRRDIEIAPIDLEHHDVPLQITVSIGVATRHDCTTDADSLVKLADEGLYRAKNSGRNRVCWVQNEWIDAARQAEA